MIVGGEFMDRVVRFVVIAVLFVPLGLWGRDIRVSGDISALQAAINGAQPGDVILIAPGVYEGNIKIEGKRDLTLRGDFTIIPPSEEICCGAAIPERVATVVIKGTLFILHSINILVENITVTGPGSGFFIQGTTVSPAKSIVIRHVAAIRNAKHGVEIVGNATEIYIFCSSLSYNGYDGVFLDDFASSVTIEACEISYNGQISATGVGIRIGAHAKNIVIKANCIVGNAFAGVHPQ